MSAPLLYDEPVSPRPTEPRFQPAVREWFTDTFTAPTKAQRLGWPAIAKGESALVFAPTGSGKTLAAFLAAIDRLMFAPVPKRLERCRVVYVLPLKALAVDVERNLRRRSPASPAWPAAAARRFTSPRSQSAPETRRPGSGPDAAPPAGHPHHDPESLFLVLTSRARALLESVDTVIVDEIHALVGTKRGAHLALTLERLEEIARRPLQRIGLSATQRPLEEVARYLGGGEGLRNWKPRR